MDNTMLMETVVFGDYTLATILIYGGIGLGGIVLLVLVFCGLKKLLTPKRTSPHMEIVTCPKCGWEGQVSRYAGRCPQCNNPLGSREAKADT